MPATRRTKTPTVTPAHRAGVTYAHPELVHAIEPTSVGLVTLCSGTDVHRPLPGTFEQLRRDRCPDCDRLVQDPGATTASHQIVLI